jgi:hypothetical protein
LNINQQLPVAPNAVVDAQAACSTFSEGMQTVVDESPTHPPISKAAARLLSKRTNWQSNKNSSSEANLVFIENAQNSSVLPNKSCQIRLSLEGASELWVTPEFSFVKIKYNCTFSFSNFCFLVSFS